jgi:hypothetical protein
MHVRCTHPARCVVINLVGCSDASIPNTTVVYTYRKPSPIVVDVFLKNSADGKTVMREVEPWSSPRPIQWIVGHEADGTSQSSVVVQNGCCCTFATYKCLYDMHRDNFNYLCYLYGDFFLLSLTCLFHIWKEIASKVKINNFVIFGYIFLYLCEKYIFDEWLGALCFLELTLFLWLVGLSTVIHLRLLSMNC